MNDISGKCLTLGLRKLSMYGYKHPHSVASGLYAKGISFLQGTRPFILESILKLCFGCYLGGQVGITLYNILCCFVNIIFLWIFVSAVSPGRLTSLRIGMRDPLGQDGVHSLMSLRKHGEL